MNREGTLEDKFKKYFIWVFFIVLVMGCVIIIYQILQKPLVISKTEIDKKDSEVSCIDEVSKDIQKLDQLSSCYKGCQFVTQPIYNLSVNNKTFRINQYDKCVGMCEYKYS